MPALEELRCLFATRDGDVEPLNLLQVVAWQNEVGSRLVAAAAWSCFQAACSRSRNRLKFVRWKVVEGSTRLGRADVAFGEMQNQRRSSHSTEVATG
jgi:hypothetical protein